MSPLFEGATGHLAKRAILVIVAPALVFWLAGTGVLFAHGDESWWRWGPAASIPGHEAWLVERLSWLRRLSSFEQSALLASVVIVSALLAELFVLDILQLAEGYWPSWLRFILRRRIARRRSRVDQARTRLAALRDKHGSHTVDESAEVTHLEDWLTLHSSARRPMPTELGDILAAAETRPADKYGLHVGLCFPRLWLVMPDSTRRELSNAREKLDTGARAWLWGLLFCLWAFLAWWALAIGVVVGWFAYRWMLAAARDYGDLLESSFDVHHAALFQALRWPMPQSPVSERAAGIEVTRYLWYPERLETPIFTSVPDTASTSAEEPESGVDERSTAHGIQAILKRISSAILR